MNAPAPRPGNAPGTSADLLQQDANSRALAIDPQRSCIVEAPAGAGKTELLTQRYLALLAQVHEPEEIVALTFTNKAAAEMRQRIVSSLHRAAQQPPPDEEHKRTTYHLARKALQRDQDAGWGLSLNPNRLHITTLDALCARLARQMPLLSRLGSQVEVCADAQPHYEQAARATLQAVEDDSPQAEALLRVLDYFDNDRARLLSLLEDMLASRDQWLRHYSANLAQDEAEQALAALIAHELRQVAAALPLGWQQELMPLARHAAAHCPELAPLADWSAPLLPEASALPAWRSLAHLLLTQGGEVRSSLPSAWGFGTASGRALGQTLRSWLNAVRSSAHAGAALQRIRKLPQPQYSASERQLLQDLVSVLTLAVAQLWLGFQRAGAVDFIAIAQGALDALGAAQSPTDLALQLDQRLSHLLVDEFQDTSPTQADLLQRLTAGWQNGDGKTLFLVGDPMQSIYKFRKADVGLFLRVREHGLGPIRLQALRLFRNNRSGASLVQWVNAVFPCVFASDDDAHRGAVRFNQAHPTQPDTVACTLRWHPIAAPASAAADEADADLEPASVREAQQVVRLIQTLQAEQPQASIAVLVRARSHLEALVQLLRSQHPQLRYQAIEVEALERRQVIQDLLSLTRALLHLGDRIHWLATLRAPWCGLLLHDLHQLAADEHRACIWSLMQDDARVARLGADGQQRLLRVRALLGTALAQQGRLRTRRWIEGVWLALGGPYALAGAADLIDARAYFEALDRIDQAGRIDLQRLSREVEQLYAAPDPQASAQLQIMTIHKSKGLEFDVVILPGLQRQPPRPERRLLLWDEVLGTNNQGQLMVAALPHGRAAAASDEPTKFDFLQQFEAERSRNETQRLLYVAVTRAKQQLHLFGSVQLDADAPDGLKPPPKDSFLALLWHAAAEPFARALQAPASGVGEPKASAAAGSAEDYPHHLQRLRLDVPTAGAG